ncbi:prepilin-type N-terminal cleavage/methylation domain-containing protein [Polynucleobacter necessarius]|uniref:PulJ/GspJ family protein n=1 Tax=Polynucleobacter necessarius TaxID=576610 RepID=UPI000E095E51
MLPITVSPNQGLNSTAGFTLVESLVAMAIFSIGFSSLYFLYNYAQIAISRTEQRMYLNLMGDRILQTIASESQRALSDHLNPFYLFR